MGTPCIMCSRIVRIVNFSGQSLGLYLRTDSHNQFILSKCLFMCSPCFCLPAGCVIANSHSPLLEQHVSLISAGLIRNILIVYIICKNPEFSQALYVSSNLFPINIIAWIRITYSTSRLIWFASQRSDVWSIFIYLPNCLFITWIKFSNLMYVIKFQSLNRSKILKRLALYIRHSFIFLATKTTVLSDFSFHWLV